MDDRLLASRAAAGDLDSFGQLFDRYVNRVYDFSWRTLRDTEGAESVTREVFEAAATNPGAAARAPSAAAWIFGLTQATTIARAESVGVVPVGPAPSSEEAFGAFGVPDPMSLNDASLVDADFDVAALTWEAVASLGPRDYTMLDLDQRQGLNAAEIGHVNGIAKAQEQVIITRMRQAAADVIASYIVARRNVEVCPQLREIVGRHPMPPYTDEARREVQAHLQSCEQCGSARRALVNPLAIVGSFSTIPAPFGFKGDMWRDLAVRWGGTTPTVGSRPDRGAISLGTAGAGGAGFAGGPRGTAAGEGADWTRNRLLLFGGAALGIIVFAFAIGAVVAGGFGGSGGGSGAPSATRTATREPTAEGSPATTASPSVSVQTATPDLTPSVTATPEDTATAVPTDTPAPPTAIPPTATRTPRPGPTPSPTRTPRPGTPTRTPAPASTPTP